MANRKFNEVPTKATIVPADEVVLVDSEDSLKLKRVSATVFKGADWAQGPQGPQGIPGTPGTGQVNWIVWGTNISVDSTDPANPVVSLSLWADENFVTDEEKAVLALTSGVNTGDQDLYFLHNTIYDESVTAISYDKRVQVIGFSDELGIPANRRLDCTWTGNWEVIAVNSSVVPVYVYDNFGSLQHVVQPGVVSFINISGTSINPIFFRSLTSAEVSKLANTSWTNTGDQDLSGLAPLAWATFTGDVVVPDEAYSATTWNGNNEVPTKNAIRDKIESMSGGGGPSPILTYSTSGILIDTLLAEVTLSQAVTFSKLSFSAGVLPIGGNAEIVVKKNGTSILSGNLAITTTEPATGTKYSVITGDAWKATITTATAATKDVIGIYAVKGSRNTFLGADISIVLTGTLA